MKNMSVILIISLLLSFFTFTITDAGNNLTDSNKVNKLKELNRKVTKYKLEKPHLINSLKKGNNYELIIHSTKSIDNIKSTLSEYSDNIKVTYVSWDTYVLQIPNNTKIAKYLLKNINKGELPSNILGFNIEQPIEVSIEWSIDFLSNEELSSLWWMKAMWADLYQEWLSVQSKIKVWIIDTWINYEHADLIYNKYVNLADTVDGVDTDWNDFIDDINWWDFVNNDNNPSDGHGHWTHVSWTVWASVNWSWVFWVNSNVDLVWLKVLWDDWTGSSQNIWDAIRYAADNGIKVLNLSLWGRWTPSGSYMCSSIDYALALWTITVVAAWNSDSDTSRYVPAWCPNAITVSAVDSTLKRAYFSNFWDEVDVAAPWVWIYSTTLDWEHISHNWTSMASPHIAWLVSAMLVYSPDLSLENIEAFLKNPALTEDVNTNKRKHIWRFASMAKIMTELWVENDDNIIVTPPIDDNSKPTLSIDTLENPTNTFIITANANDSDWTIENYEFSIDGNIQQTGTWNIFDITIVTGTNVKIAVTDNEWATTSKTILLNWTNTSNKVPIINNLSVRVKWTNHTLTVDASDTDGQIVNYDYFIYTDDAPYNEVSSSSNKYKVSISKNYSKEVRVDIIVYDNDWWISLIWSKVIFTPK